uniref:Rubrerythrin diiron-binding domain-containing protein n=1 Tax=candidate division WOR-3 bacterium TaxID=2052148 RepID=A0A7C3UPD8_UNCW3
MKEKEVHPYLFAIGEEKKALITYLRFAYQTKNPSGKDMFIRLAMDEFEHMTSLEEFLLTAEEKVPISEISDLIPKLPEKEIKTFAEGDISDLNALQIARELEERAIDFYRKEKENAKEEKAHSLWKRLEEMEISHYNLIQAEIDSINKTGFWFSVREFTLEGER